MALSVWGRLDILRAEDFQLEETHLLLSKPEHRIGKEALHTDRKRVSTSHIALRRDAVSGAVTITDTSQWGTFVGGVKLDFKKPTPLVHGALITLAIAEYSECMFALRFHSSDGGQLEPVTSPRNLLVSTAPSPCTRRTPHIAPSPTSGPALDRGAAGEAAALDLVKQLQPVAAALRDRHALAALELRQGAGADPAVARQQLRQGARGDAARETGDAVS